MAVDDRFVELSPEEADELNAVIGEVLGLGSDKETAVYDIPEQHPDDPGIVLMRLERKFVLEHRELKEIVIPLLRGKGLKKRKPQVYVDAQLAREAQEDLQ